MTYCAFLRGVNVNGTAMKMADVCGVFENAGMQNVTSVLATGNIIFNSEENADSLKVMLEKAMSEHFNYEAFMFIKSADEINRMLQNNPFEKSEDAHIYVFVTASGTETILMETFMQTENSAGEKAEIAEGTFYWQVKKGNALDSGFGKILGQKSMKDKLTSRNLNTFEKIVKKL